MNFFDSPILKTSGITVEKNVILGKYTTMRVGGPADYFVEPQDENALRSVLRAAREGNIPVLLMGNGSNLLVRDGGFRGVAVRLGKGFSAITKAEHGLYAQSGALLSALARAAAEEKLTGLEFAQGIPGTVGGGVYMNAGAYGGELAHTVETVRALRGDEIVSIPGEEMRFGYRHSRAMEENLIVLGASFRLERGDTAQIEAAMRDFALRRREKQPLEYPSCGSFFKRPQGHFAGALIEQAGLKGKSVGGAQVSEKHAGFLINQGGATARDVLDLMALVQRTVEARFQVRLEPEVRIVGEDA